MELNRIYRYYGLPKAQAYEPIKNILTEAFTGFEGVSFETIEATDDSSEEFKIFIDEQKSTWLNLTDEPNLSIGFYDNSKTSVSVENSAATYRGINVVRTRYGVAFSPLITKNDKTPETNDIYFKLFFVKNNPNVLVYSRASSNTSGSYSPNYLFSNLHETPEAFNSTNSLYPLATPRTKLFNAGSVIKPIEFENFYRVAYSDGKTGKIHLEDKYVILGAAYALEYDPTDDGVEF